MKHLSIFFFLFFVMVGCAPSIPNDYIQPDEMEDILYDYQLAQAMGNQSNDRGQIPTDVDKNVFKMAALKKYGLTEKEFDRSLEYYLRHTEELHKIYERLSERFSNEAVALGSNVSDADFRLAQQGDTTNVWNKASAFVLSADEYLNQEVFTIKPDTSFHKGDKLMLDFDNQFIVQDGSRDAVALLVVTLSNDSIVSQTCRISSNGHHAVTFNDNERLGIKQIRGFFLLNKGENDSESTLKLLLLYNVKLVRMHTLENKTSTTSSADSLKRQQTIQSEQNVQNIPNGAPLPSTRTPSSAQPVAMPPSGNHLEMQKFEAK